MTTILFLLSLLCDDVLVARKPVPTPAAKQYMIECVEQGYSKNQCYWSYWDAYQLGYGLEFPSTWA